MAWPSGPQADTGAWAASSHARLNAMQRWIIVFGILCVVIGLLWPWLSKLPLGRLPGDFVIRRDGFSFYFPLTTSILISLLLSLLFWLLRK